MKIIMLESPNFVFHAAGNTEDEARAALKSGITEHSRQTGANLTYMLECIEDANIIDIYPGVCLRDYQTITTGEKA